ncbi:MAG TPA: TetR/AcrR family transcriptional regulator C-terminal domain-containing protein, partial [Acidimicrobiales bacterium]|nr:TetR/AcrR family transcriptional regulator C-terminal domain-containing protein [Acidimicrobiales bacterium]
AIYWHIGNRDALLDALIEEEMAGWNAIRPTGSSSQARIVSFARVLRKRLLARRNIVEMVSERGLIFDIFIPTYEVLAGEFLSAGLDESQAALAVRTIQHHVVGAVVLQRRVEGHPQGRAASSVASKTVSKTVSKSEELGEFPDEASVVTKLALAIPTEKVFEYSTKLLVASLLAN